MHVTWIVHSRTTSDKVFPPVFFTETLPCAHGLLIQLCQVALFAQSLITLTWCSERRCYRSEEWEIPCGRHAGYLVTRDECHTVHSVKVDSNTDNVFLKIKTGECETRCPCTEKSFTFLRVALADLSAVFEGAPANQKLSSVTVLVETSSCVCMQ